MVFGVIIITAGIDSFSTVTGVLDGKGAAGHGKVIVCLDTGRSAIFGVLFVPGHSTRHGHHVRAAFYKDIIVRGDAFLPVTGCVYNQEAVGKLDIVFSLESVSGPVPGVDLDGWTVHQPDIIIGRNSRFFLFVQSVDGKQAASTEDQLGFAEKNGLQIFLSNLCVGGRFAVGQRIVAIDRDERAFLVLVVEGCSVRVGEAYPVQDDGLFLHTIYFKGSVGRGPGEFIDEDFAAGVVHGDMVPIDANIAIAVAGYDRIARLGELDGYLPLEGGGGDVVIGFRVAR